MTSWWAKDGRRRSLFARARDIPSAHPGTGTHFDHEVARILPSVHIRADTNPIMEPYDNWYENQTAQISLQALGGKLRGSRRA